ncbi:MAG: (4Fe-4S)-binding protein [Chitinophagales bacterium]|nr:(4Fe-4S)-binding protein [Chitinophagales bacterium]
MERKITRKYSNGEVTIVWKPDVCIHSAICFKGLPEVFDPRVRPWINAEGASTQQIIDQVKKCPSGALTYEINSLDASTAIGQ